MTTAEAVILAVVEGLTEFLPISSTGHLILTEALMKMQNNTSANFLRVFTVNIQFGAIFAVVILYWRRFFQSFDLYPKLAVAFIPAGVIGLLLNKTIDRYLSNMSISVITVAVSLIVGGIVLILMDKIFHRQIEGAPRGEPDTVMVKKVNEFGIEIKQEKLRKFSISWLQAFIIGCFQCIAMIPGVSRSAITIVGGLTQKFDIKKAAEFSFFLAVPTTFAASAYKLLESFNSITGNNINQLIMGNAISFVIGMLAIKFFIGLITRYGLKFFGYYRILLGAVILILLSMGHKLQFAG